MGNSLIITKSTLDEVYDLSPRLREDDRREVIASGSSPEQALLLGLINSEECLSAYTKDHKLIGMFGYSVIKENPTLAAIWFLGSDEIEKYPLTFVRDGKKFINKWNEKYTLVNCVYSQNKTHIKYIEALGCTIKYNSPVDINGEIFYPFYKHKKG